MEAVREEKGSNCMRPLSPASGGGGLEQGGLKKGRVAVSSECKSAATGKIPACPVVLRRPNTVV